MSAILKFIRENHILALIEQAIVKKKSRLSLNGYEIHDIPNLLYDCLEVEHLYLHKNKIQVLPVEIVHLVNLTTLTLDYNNISFLPSEIGNLKNLVNLNISYNPLGVLVPEIGELENLEAFWCNKIGLREIPKEIGKLAKLDTFGARGNEIKTIPEEMTALARLRWLTLENNQIEQLPSTMNRMVLLVHCNLRNNRITQFPESILKCSDLMFLQLNNNLIASLPESLDTSSALMLEMIDLRDNPVSVVGRPEHPLIRCHDGETGAGVAPARAHSFSVNATPLRIPAGPAPRHAPEPAVVDVPPTLRLLATSADAATLPGPVIIDLEMDASSGESSEDWENSVNSSELDVQYQSDDERADNEAVGMVLPELSRYASTAS